ncbi:hypothetical protein LXL04_015792 [Taraxacum kok-saghyz]
MDGGGDVAMTPAGLDWKFSVDVISAIEFDKAGDHLATGDRGGRVVLFERTDQTNHGVHRRVLEGMDCSSSRHPEYRYKTEFQSNEPELGNEEKINKIKWCQTVNSSLFLLSTNDKTIKFWKVQEKKIKKICNFNLDPSKQLRNGFICSSNAPTSLRLPMSFNIVDMKPANMEDLTEVIISADFHPSHCNVLAYSSSKGSIRLLDLRQSALCDNHCKFSIRTKIEPDTEICANMLDALNECLEICGQVLDENQERNIVDEIKQVITRVKKHLLNNQLLLLRLICANGGCNLLGAHGVHRRVLEGMDCSSSRHPEYRYKTEFQSNEPEVQEKKIKKICNFNLDPSKQLRNGFICSSNALTSLRLPMVTSHDTSLLARCRRTFAHAHDYHINSISNNSDGETFISADGLRINLWNLEINSQSFNIVDMKPANMEDLTEVIISADFHPSHCNVLAYSSSKGSIRLLDLRQSALCDNHSKFSIRTKIEPDTEICANMLDALNECLEICGQVLDENQERNIVDEIKQVITRVKKHLLNNQLLLLRLICANGGCNLLGAV